MKAIILAAGRGSRMHEGTANNPKCMMKVCDKTLVERCMDTLHKANFKNEDIAIVTGYKSELLREAFPEVTFFHNEVWDQTNMVYSLTKAEKWLSCEDCIVVYSDIIFSPKVLDRIAPIEEDMVIPYYTNYLELWKQRFENPLEDLETFSVDTEGNLLDIGSRPNSFDQVHGQYMGIVKYTPKGWNDFITSIDYSPKPIEKTDMTTMLNASLKANHKIRCVKCEELWLECDNQNDIKIYEENYSELLN